MTTQERLNVIKVISYNIKLHIEKVKEEKQAPAQDQLDWVFDAGIDEDGVIKALKLIEDLSSGIEIDRDELQQLENYHFLFAGILE